MDVINTAMLFAATLLLCLFSFLMVASALAGMAGRSPGLLITRRETVGPVLLIAGVHDLLMRSVGPGRR